MMHRFFILDMSKFNKVLFDWEKTVKIHEQEAKKCERLLTKIVKETTLDYSRHKRLNRHFGEITNSTLINVI